MTTEMISLGSCPTCRGPAQFIAPETNHASGCEYPSGGLCHCSTPEVRYVHLPNIDEDLGDGWRFDSLLTWSVLSGNHRRYRALAISTTGLQLEGFGDSPSQAYLALRTAIEARP